MKKNKSKKKKINKDEVIDEKYQMKPEVFEENPTEKFLKEYMKKNKGSK